MISRKIEIALIILGATVFAFFSITGINMLIINQDEEAALAAYEQISLEVEDDDIPTFEQFSDMLFPGGISIIAISGVSIIVGMVSIFLLKGNKRPKPAGILVLIVGGVIGFLQFGIALFGSLFYLIAGLLVLFKKPKTELQV
ncbi:Protein of unknown function [Amphibacillus marinus]|uniref:DUF4064 domain-containing protein n=1 Tax=Amphibacillus marinus TaxID=872970 RepID=A0A1H8JXG8_9BACI|nr:DUF4064 domain-containing protein [Amphibacillus marinus]SEN85205.1 Protein of unknown function [Amphibacillus marinus]